MVTVTPSLKAEPCLTALLVYCCVLLHLCGGQCPREGSQSPVLGDKVEGSEVVVQGQVMRQLKVKDDDRSYTVELRVQCVYKGGPVPALIHVTGAGQAAESCVKTEFPRGSMKLAYLRRSGGQFSPTFTEDPAERKYLDELQYACGLHVQFPTGGENSGNSAYCNPDKFVSYYDDCQDSTPSATAATTSSSWTMVLCGVALVVLIRGRRLRLL